MENTRTSPKRPSCCKGHFAVTLHGLIVGSVVKGRSPAHMPRQSTNTTLGSLSFHRLEKKPSLFLSLCFKPVGPWLILSPFPDPLPKKPKKNKPKEPDGWKPPSSHGTRRKNKLFSDKTVFHPLPPPPPRKKSKVVRPSDPKTHIRRPDVFTSAMGGQRLGNIAPPVWLVATL